MASRAEIEIIGRKVKCWTYTNEPIVDVGVPAQSGEELRLMNDDVVKADYCGTVLKLFIASTSDHLTI